MQLLRGSSRAHFGAIQATCCLHSGDQFDHEPLGLAQHDCPGGPEDQPSGPREVADRELSPHVPIGQGPPPGDRMPVEQRRSRGDVDQTDRPVDPRATDIGSTSAGASIVRAGRSLTVMARIRSTRNIRSPPDERQYPRT